MCEKSLGKTELQCLLAINPHGLNSQHQHHPCPGAPSDCQEHCSFPEVAPGHESTVLISACISCVPESITDLQKQRNTEMQLTVCAGFVCSEWDGSLLFVASFHYPCWKNADASTLLLLAKGIQSPKIFQTLLIGCFLAQIILNKFPWKRTLWNTQLA